MKTSKRTLSQFDKEKKHVCMILTIMCTLIVPMGFFGCSSTPAADNTPVKSIDLEQYLGRWYEVARLDHKFERGMTNCTAVYLPNPNGTMRVINKGLKNGEEKTSMGKAKQTATPGLLRVSFFGPLFYSDYRIMMVPSDYSYSLVGSSDEDYLWILSRTPTLPKDTINNILREAKRRGYDTQKLVWVSQDATAYNQR